MRMELLLRSSHKHHRHHILPSSAWQCLHSIPTCRNRCSHRYWRYSHRHTPLLYSGNNLRISQYCNLNRSPNRPPYSRGHCSRKPLHHPACHSHRWTLQWEESSGGPQDQASEASPLCNSRCSHHHLRCCHHRILRRTRQSRCRKRPSYRKKYIFPLRGLERSCGLSG